ncbi:MAG: TonB-dependent receptor [Bacteroidota bacterium]|nr:TonB-dependent receptor [Bacteroidota bacterium]
MEIKYLHIKLLLKFSLLFLSFISIALIQSAYSQSLKQATLNGVVLDNSTQKPLQYTSVALLTIKDSTLVKGCITNSKGEFVLKNVNPGSYRIRISYLGYSTIRKIIAIQNTGETQNLGNFVLAEVNSLMNEVVITPDQPVTVKQDTVEFNADLFQVEKNAVVEDMLKKLPGVEIDGQGKIQAQGMDVTRVFVDGKPFFGNDPLIATQNLPAEMIAKIQVIDKKSDQAEFSGVDDGEVEKVINIVTRKGYKEGYFGKASLGYGSLDRYDDGFMVNRFVGDRQMSLLGMSNNTNTQRFTLDALNSLNDKRKSTLSSARAGRNSSRGGAARGFSSMSSAGRSMSANGISTTNAAGANYHNLIGTNLSVTGSYFFNSTETNNNQTGYTQTFKVDTSIYKRDTTATYSRNINHRANMEIDYQIDSLNSILFKPNISYAINSSSRASSSNTIGESGARLNESNSANRSDGTNLNSNFSLLYRKKFKKPRRSFSINVGGSLKTGSSDGFRKSFIKRYVTSNGVPTIGLTDINTKSESSGTGYNARLSYTEPISLHQTLDLNYYYSRSDNQSTKSAYRYDEADSLYDIPDTAYSNHFNNTFINQRTGLSLQSKYDKLLCTIGVGVESAQIESKTKLLNRMFDRTHKSMNFSPTATINYAFTNRRRLSLQYKGTTNEPSIDQLQPIITDSNALIIRIGNPNLKSSFTNDLVFSYNDVNPKTFSNYFVNIQYSSEQNSISNNYINGASGEQLIMPVNVNGAWDASTNIGMGKSLAKNKFYISTSGSVKWNNDVNYDRNNAKTLTNYNPLDTAASVLNTTRHLALGYNLQASVNTDLIMLTVSGRVNYNHVWQATKSNSPSIYTSYNLLGDLKLFLPLNIMLNTDYQINMNSGFAKGYNNSFALWNAAATKDFLKNKRGQFKFQIFDILRQNQSVRHSITDHNITDMRSTILPQYFIFSFTYNFRNFKRHSGEMQQVASKPDKLMRKLEKTGGKQNSMDN